MSRFIVGTYSTIFLSCGFEKRKKKNIAALINGDQEKTVHLEQAKGNAYTRPRTIYQKWVY